jgi:uncharacterized cupredoxin-like copper-binding protein
MKRTWFPTRGLLIAATLVCSAAGARAQSSSSGKIDPTWLRTDSVTHSAEFRLVAGLTDRNGGMNFNGFGKGGLVLTVPKGWSVVLHFKNQDQNLPHSAEVIADMDPVPVGPVPPAFEHAATARVDQGFSAGQGEDVRFVAAKAGSYLIFCAVPGHGPAGMWIRLVVSATAVKPALSAAPEH